MVGKHSRSSSTSSIPQRDSKKARTMGGTFKPNKIATAEAAAAVDNDPPLPKLLEAVKKTNQKPKKGESVIYWMRMNDLRISDNKALSMASEQAQKDKVPLIAIFVLSPQDYIAHDRSARRIDFVLRNLSLLKSSFADLHIPLHVFSHSPRRTLPSRVLEFAKELGSTSVYGNIEYEVDELRRDIKFCEEAQKNHMSAIFVHNKCVIEPGVIKTKEGRAYAVYSPWQRTWIRILNEKLSTYLKDWPSPKPNDKSIRESKKFGYLFDSEVPESVPGFELPKDNRNKMIEVFPAGEEAAQKILYNFLHTKARSSQLGASNPLAEGAQESDKSSRIKKYGDERDRADKDTTSRLSVYLAAGIISPRECIRCTMDLTGSKSVDGGRNTGIGRWVQEVAWRDFYTGVLAGFPRVSMGRPFIEKYAGVVWEAHQTPADSKGKAPDTEEDSENLKRWKDGTTGVPIVDATMRCINEMGWVHNRCRMITAMFLTKDLMIDWRVGERYFMEQLIDGDLASNNGGWQWSASTGVDPAPYFRIFNPYSQSAKADPTGDFIRTWVPELAKLRGPDLHNPSASAANKLGYPRPIIDHSAARDRALRRFKNPGEE